MQALKEICWGGSNMVPRPEWIKSSLTFNEAEQLNAFGLKAEKVHIIDNIDYNTVQCTVL